MFSAVEGLRFGYALHLLPPGRVGFRRWRYELWHGAHLHAAGWCTDRRLAERALRRHAARAAHGLFGLNPDPEVLAAIGGSVPPGATVHVEAGGVRASLVPKALLAELEPTAG